MELNKIVIHGNSIVIHFSSFAACESNLEGFSPLLLWINRCLRILLVKRWENNVSICVQNRCKVVVYIIWTTTDQLLFGDMALKFNKQNQQQTPTLDMFLIFLICAPMSNGKHLRICFTHLSAVIGTRSFVFFWWVVWLCSVCVCLCSVPASFRWWFVSGGKPWSFVNLKGNFPLLVSLVGFIISPATANEDAVGFRSSSKPACGTLLLSNSMYYLATSLYYLELVHSLVGVFVFLDKLQ